MSLSEAQKLKLAALKKVCNSASEQTIADVSSSSDEVTIPQIEQAGNKTSRGTTTPVAALSEPQFRRHTPQDEERRRSSGPMDISLSSLDPPSQLKLVQYPAQMTANGKPKRSFNASYYGKQPWVEYSVQDDSVYCFCCIRCGGISTLPGQRYGSTPFIDVGVRRWKDISNVNKQHTRSDHHQDSAISWTKFKAIQTKDIHLIASILMRNGTVKSRKT
ncbi:hypothetical protein QYM36_018477 [Artemia franciscana]|uniref:TTF-type domain-containing protein n=1 Tax=Artemia franciscana TaxID=6661 RepID=A0AA88HCS5_ARTSF|nr:hypothetical protein QYM36_018477 [Artemia franciscana]